MAKYFVRGKYEKNIISKETFEEWKKNKPEYEEVKYSDFTRYWYYLRTELFDSIIENPSGVDLPLYMGNLSVKVLDIDFKCTEDFLKSTLKDKETGNFVRIPFIKSEMPKGIKIVWTKHKLFKSLASVFGCEANKTMKITISKGVREGDVNNYEKAFQYDKKPSKCPVVEEKSLFDTA